MKSTKINRLYGELCSVALFRSVLKREIFLAFFDFCEAEGEFAMRRAYARIASEIYNSKKTLAEYVASLVFEDENEYVRARARGDVPKDALTRAKDHEIGVFSSFAALSTNDFLFAMELPIGSYVPPFDTGEVDISGEYERRMLEIDRYGYGIFSAYGMFRMSDNLEIEPIVSQDRISKSSFVGYERERGLILDNTRAHLSGRPAANALLFGDAGTGKSSTVKAIVNDLFSEGLRLIELRRDQLKYLPRVMARVSGNPLKFIIFIDDLSFREDDDNYSMLKAALEGSASAVADNCLIYATSNRRHLVKETFSERVGDDIHRNDTVEETLSLSERFGLSVLFAKPDKRLYLEIVRKLAERYGIDKPKEELEIQAEAFALGRGHRSARCAEQFIKSIVSKKQG